MKKHLTIDFRRLAFYFTPSFKRYLPGPNLTFRIRFLQYLVTPLISLMQDFNEYRREIIIRANVTGQTLSLQWWLQRKFNAPIRIYHYSDGGIYIAKENEGGFDFIELGLYDPEAADGFTAIAKSGEITRLNGVNFYVDVPAGINIDEVIAEIENYRIAGKKPEIVTV